MPQASLLSLDGVSIVYYGGRSLQSVELVPILLRVILAMFLHIQQSSKMFFSKFIQECNPGMLNLCVVAINVALAFCMGTNITTIMDSPIGQPMAAVSV